MAGVHFSRFSKVEAERGKQKQCVLTETVPRKASRSLKNLKCCVPVSSHDTRAACQPATGGSMVGCCFTPRSSMSLYTGLLGPLISYLHIRGADRKRQHVSSTPRYKEFLHTKEQLRTPSLWLPQGCSPPTRKPHALPFLERST